MKATGVPLLTFTTPSEQWHITQGTCSPCIRKEAVEETRYAARRKGVRNADRPRHVLPSSVVNEAKCAIGGSW